MGRYDHLKEKPRKPINKKKMVEKIGLILLIITALVGLFIRLIIELKK